MTLYLYQEKINKFLSACHKDSPDLVSYIDAIRVNKNQKNKILCEGFIISCQIRVINNMKIMYQYPAIEEFCNNAENVNKLLKYATEDFKTYFLEYLLTEPMFNKMNIHQNKEALLRKAIQKEKIEFIKFLLLEEKVTDHANIYANKNQLLFEALKYANNNSLKVLISECGIKFNQQLQEEMIIEGGYASVLREIKKLEIINFKENLDKNLNNSDKKTPKFKI